MWQQQLAKNPIAARRLAPESAYKLENVALTIA